MENIRAVRLKIIAVYSDAQTETNITTVLPDYVMEKILDTIEWTEKWHCNFKEHQEYLKSCEKLNSLKK